MAEPPSLGHLPTPGNFFFFFFGPGLSDGLPTPGPKTSALSCAKENSFFLRSAALSCAKEKEERRGAAPSTPVACDRVGVRVGTVRIAASPSTTRNGGALVVQSETTVHGGLPARGVNLITHAVAEKAAAANATDSKPGSIILEATKTMAERDCRKEIKDLTN
ncbi:uncharacterized protein LOC144563901 [Carex rostrata]